MLSTEQLFIAKVAISFFKDQTKVQLDITASAVIKSPLGQGEDE
jgi:hypothetical protein